MPVGYGPPATGFVPSNLKAPLTTDALHDVPSLPISRTPTAPSGASPVISIRFLPVGAHSSPTETACPSAISAAVAHVSPAKRPPRLSTRHFVTALDTRPTLSPLASVNSGLASDAFNPLARSWRSGPGPTVAACSPGLALVAEFAAA